MKRLLSLLFILCLTIGLLPAYAASEPFRAVWVSTVYQLDYPVHTTDDPAELKKMADEILDHSKEMGFNAVVLQVRPAADAFYRSDIFPWSPYLTGRSGVAPRDGFDPLSYWIEAAHERGLELHAWINPYRAAMSDADFNALDASHPAKKNPSWVVRHADGRYYFDPGIPEVRKLVADGVREITSRYAVDGIHLDDYFYPDAKFKDEKTFAQYGAGFKSISDWRRNNVDMLIQEISQITRGTGKVFGVSPFGIWANRDSMPEGSDTHGNQSYSSHFADTRKWVKNGWIDYICPQLYWNIGYASANYEVLANWWADVVRGTGVSLYIGMGDYKAGAQDGNDPWHGTAEIERQIQLNRKVPEIKGDIHFRYGAIIKKPELITFYKNEYTGVMPEPPKQHLLAHKPYIEGINGAFKAQDQLTRAQAAMLFARIMGEMGKPAFDKNASYPTQFHDVSANKWYANAIGYMEQFGILKGYADGTFCPEKTITRAEFSAIVSRFGELQYSEMKFPDVVGGHWAIKYIADAVAKGYMSGYDDGSFRPERSITRAETVKIVNRVLKRTPDRSYLDRHSGINSFKDISRSHWAYYEILEASCQHEYVLNNGVEQWGGGIPREEIFQSDTFKFVFPELITTAPLEPLDLNKVDSIALHHMAHPTADFKTVEGWHLKQGWRAFGYNFWIDFEGNVCVGRGFNLGAGVANHNGHVLSIGFQGDYDGVNQTMPEAQYRAGVELMKWLKQRVPTIKQAGGHKDFNATVCPGRYFPLDNMCSASGIRQMHKQ